MITLSIITVNFNNATGLEKTINSVLSQTYSSIEYIIIDGGSKDGSKDLIKQNDDKISYWVSEKDNGIYHAMNKGLEKASGDYLIFLNSGDCFINESILQQCYDFMQQCPGADIYYGDIVFVNVPNRTISIPWAHPEKLDLIFLKLTTINHQASLIKSSLFRELGLYPANYKIAADYWLWLTSLLHNKSFKHIGLSMVYYDHSGISYTNRKLYLLEKQQIWDSLIPKCVQDLVAENEQYRQLTEYKLVKAAIRLNKKYQSLKAK